ncbi:hypothetical protein V1520DRAFT_350032 [Lipomyces starkeyi]
MGAMYALSHSQHEVHLFEADCSWGGHSYTHIVEKNCCKTGVDLQSCDISYVFTFLIIQHWSVEKV